MKEYKHIPVMLNEVIDFLSPKKNQNFIDCTLGGAGYTVAIAKLILPKGKILSIDLDKLAVRNAETVIKKENLKNIKIAHGNFKDIAKILQNNWENPQDAKINGIVFDLGLSSAQLKDERRGFSFQLDAPLDMAFGAQQECSTEQIINNWREKEIEKILKDYGEERFAKSIARRIIDARKDIEIKNTKQLVDIIAEAVPGKYRNNRKIHFATRTFQALRIATNDELNSLKKALPEALNILTKGGRIVVISYHSLEDRIVKHFFKKEAKDCLCPPELPVCRCGHKAGLKIITKKALPASAEEVKKNPRSRSAKMRVIEKK
ncbi:16S rRNA (cytosine(1402)-N(4))-methyltransferase RsmH [Candidatus Parcubacteria bacterium]|nr:16S rRNA (cytosine(1402)-N(4))-methyltransferase RsmH [Candidatus Parcubacteria bacterium]